jgi:hypothetical protein
VANRHDDGQFASHPLNSGRSGKKLTRLHSGRPTPIYVTIITLQWSLRRRSTLLSTNHGRLVTFEQHRSTRADSCTHSSQPRGSHESILPPCAQKIRLAVCRICHIRHQRTGRSRRDANPTKIGSSGKSGHRVSFRQIRQCSCSTGTESRSDRRELGYDCRPRGDEQRRHGWLPPIGGRRQGWIRLADGGDFVGAGNRYGPMDRPDLRHRFRQTGCRGLRTTASSELRGAIPPRRARSECRSRITTQAAARANWLF